METRSAPTTPVTTRAVACGNPEPAHRFSLSIVTTVYNHLFSCFVPNGVGLQTSNTSSNASASTYLEDDWEVPFESITALEWLAAGSQGAVFKGKLNGEMIAVKKVKTKEETEIKHLQYLNHENVMKFYGVSTQAPCFCLLMEYCGKGQLFQLIQNGCKIGKEQFSDWARQIADGMRYLHSKKIIHRDLKSPNILVNDRNVLKICDFGNSHIWDKQRSTVMSFCGTAAWMAPEIIKKEPSSEKVDIWSFGVVLWELLTTEAPYKDVDSMAIIYGVGSNQLSLPIPDMAPDGIKLLLKQCWSSKPRNRPSFNHILTHIAVFKSEVEGVSEREWAQKVEGCKEYVTEYMKRIPQDGKIKTITDVAQLEQRWEEKMRHLQDIRELFDKKMRRADKMCCELTNCLEEIAVREQELRHKELELRERELQISSTRTTPANSVKHKRSHNSVQKSMGVRADINLINGSLNSGKQNVHPYIANRVPAYDNESGWVSSSDDDVDVIPIQRSSSARLSGLSVCSAGVPSAVIKANGISRQSSARSSSGPNRRTTASPSRLPVSTSERSFSRDSSLRFSNGSFHNGGDLRRGSSARNSGYSEFSNDSGIQTFCGAESMTTLSNVDLTLEPRNCGHCGQSLRSTHLYRNMENNHSDGRLSNPQRRRNRRSSSGISRESSQTPVRSKERHIPYNRTKQLANEVDSSNNFIHDPQTTSTDLDVENGNCHPRCPNNSAKVLSAVQLCPAMLRQSTSYEEAMHCEPAIMSHVQKTYPQLEAESHPARVLPHNDRDSNYPDSDTSSEGSLGDNELCNGNICESSMDSSYADFAFRRLKNAQTSGDDSERSSKLLITSTSTNTSSLERSLEMAAMHSDGLSDKESRVKAVKNTIMTHRRTASNPISIPSAVYETSTESECEAVYC